MVYEVFMCGDFLVYPKKPRESDLNIVIRNKKIVWKHGPYCWYFRLNLKYLGWLYREYINKNSQKQWILLGIV